MIEPELKTKQAQESTSELYDKNAAGKTVTREFLKKFISFAKSQKAPELTQEVIEFCANVYKSIRFKAQGAGD